MFEYDIDEKSWNQLFFSVSTDMPSPRYAHATQLIEPNYLIIYGGSDG